VQRNGAVSERLAELVGPRNPAPAAVKLPLLEARDDVPNDVLPAPTTLPAVEHGALGDGGAELVALHQPDMLGPTGTTPHPARRLSTVGAGRHVVTVYLTSRPDPFRDY